MASSSDLPSDLCRRVGLRGAGNDYAEERDNRGWSLRESFRYKNARHHDCMGPWAAIDRKPPPGRTA